MAFNTDEKKVHVAVFPPAGMGPTLPFLHLARTLAIRHGLSVTFITTETNVNPWETAHADSLAASALDIRVVKLRVQPNHDAEAAAVKEDPFFSQWEATRKSMVAFEKLLASDLLNHSWRPPISALFTDPIFSTTVDITARYNVPNYFVCPVSAFFVGLVAYLAIEQSSGNELTDPHADTDLQIPGFPLLPSSQIPGFLKIKGNIFRRVMLSCGSDMNKADGILINTLEELEPQCLQALRSGEVASDMPPVYAIGPLFLHNPWTLDSTEDDQVFRWLDAQPAKSVVFVSFGSRAALSAEEIKELALGLECSQQRFLWRVRTSVIENASSDEEIESILPAGFMSRVKSRGLVVSSWVPQTRILCHPSVGVFVSHCGWNSTLESICCGVPFVGWPLFGDQMMNSKVAVEIAKVGVEVRRRDSDGVVPREEVQRALEAARAEELGRTAAKFKEFAKRATTEGGVCDAHLQQIIQSWK